MGAKRRCAGFIIAVMTTFPLLEQGGVHTSAHLNWKLNWNMQRVAYQESTGCLNVTPYDSIACCPMKDIYWSFQNGGHVENRTQVSSLRTMHSATELSAHWKLRLIVKRSFNFHSQPHAFTLHPFIPRTNGKWRTMNTSFVTINLENGGAYGNWTHVISMPLRSSTVATNAPLKMKWGSMQNSTPFVRLSASSIQ